MYNEIPAFTVEIEFLKLHTICGTYNDLSGTTGSGRITRIGWGHYYFCRNVENRYITDRSTGTRYNFVKETNVQLP